MHGMQHAFAAITRFLSIAQLTCLILPGRRAGRHGGTPYKHAVVAAYAHLDLHSRIAARIQNFAPVYIHNFNRLFHAVLLFVFSDSPARKKKRQTANLPEGNRNLPQIVNSNGNQSIRDLPSISAGWGRPRT